MAKLSAYGGAGSTTGANFLLEVEDALIHSTARILVDCGMEQGINADAHNRSAFAYEPKEIDYLFVTHAHIDHVGLIPKLVRDGFRGEIYSTSDTREISALLLADALKIGLDKDVSLFSSDDMKNAFGLWQTIEYRRERKFPGFSVIFHDAGHILGSSMVKFMFNGKSMLFTGDIGNSPSLLLEDVEKITGLDYMLIESVYGDRNHEERDSREKEFERVVSESINRGGTLLIPAFSLERTQEILMLLDRLFEKQKIPSAPVYLDSPLAERITPIFERALGKDKFNFSELIKIANVGQSQEISSVEGPKIIIAGSGMSTGGRIVGHERLYLPDRNSTILFMGYQALGTLGREIVEGKKTVIIDGEEVDVRAKVEKIDGFSGHADSDALVNFVSHSAKTLKKVFVAMGEPKSAIFLAQRIRDELDVNAIVLEQGKTYELG